MAFNSEEMADELRAWRELLGQRNEASGEWEIMWQEKAAEIVGVAGHTWSRWENGSPVQQPLMLRRALLQYALERGISVPDYLRRKGGARLKALKEATASAQAA